MTSPRRFVVITVALGALAFLLGPHAPLGTLLWPDPVPLAAEPTAVQTGLFVVLFAATALAFGAGVAFAVLGWPKVREVFGPDRAGLARAAHVSVVWVLWNWWLHDALHMVVGSRPGGLLAIEYAFHLTIIVAGAVLAYSLFVLAGERPGRRPAPSELAGAGT